MPCTHNDFLVKIFRCFGSADFSFLRASLPPASKTSRESTMCLSTLRRSRSSSRTSRTPLLASECKEDTGNKENQCFRSYHYVYVPNRGDLLASDRSVRRYFRVVNTTCTRAGLEHVPVVGYRLLIQLTCNEDLPA